MNIFYSHLGLFVTLAICAVVIFSGFSLWSLHTYRNGSAPSDSQIVRLLVALLLFAACNIGLFMLVILGK